MLLGTRRSGTNNRGRTIEEEYGLKLEPESHVDERLADQHRGLALMRLSSASSSARVMATARRYPERRGGILTVLAVRFESAAARD